MNCSLSITQAQYSEIVLEVHIFLHWISTTLRHWKAYVVARKAVYLTSKKVFSKELRAKNLLSWVSVKGSPKRERFSCISKLPLNSSSEHWFHYKQKIQLRSSLYLCISKFIEDRKNLVRYLHIKLTAYLKGGNLVIQCQRERWATGEVEKALLKTECEISSHSRYYQLRNYRLNLKISCVLTNLGLTKYHSNLVFWCALMLEK